MKKFLLLLLFVVSISANAQTTLYVAKTGLDTNSGTSSSPFLTIQKAVDVASNGDAILVNPGIYSETISINKSLNIFATGSYLDTVLEPSNPNSPIFTIFEQNFDQNNIVNVTIKGFKFRNSNNQFNDPLAIRIERAAFASIQKCWFENIRRGISTYYGYYHVINSVFKDVEYLSFNDAGFTDDARLPKIINCTIYNSYSITNSGANIYNKIYNSIIVSDDNKTKSYFNGSRPYLNKVIIDDAPNAISGSDFSTVSNVNSIHFNDLSNKDFRLKAYSPAIGYGTDMSIIEDLSAGARPLPVATTADAGAFENVLGTAVNAPPTINTISNVTINEDDSLQTVAFSGISDGDLFSTQTVAVTSASSNLALIPNPTLAYTSGDTTGSLQFTPVADQSGTATITVTVTDAAGTTGGGVNTITKSFTVTVNPVNDAPLATPQILSTPQDTNKVITLAGTDIDTNVSSLTYSITVLPTSGSLYQTTNGTSLGTRITTVPTVVTNSDGKVIYEPVWNVSGNGTGTFSFKANDGSVLSSQADVIVNTTAVTYPVISISSNPTSFAENETSTITATIDRISSRDLVVPLTFTGTAKLDEDYNGTFISKGIAVISAGGNGAGISSNQLSLPEKIAVDDTGNLFIADYNNNRIQKWAPNSGSGETIISGVTNPIDVQIAANGDIFVLETGKVTKWTASGVLIGVVSSGISSSPSGMFIDTNLNIFTTGFFDNSVFKSTPSTVQAIKLIDNPGGDFFSPESVVSDNLGNLYIANRNGKIIKWNTTNQQSSTIISTSGVRDLAINSKGNLIIPKGGTSRQDYSFSVAEYTLTGTFVKNIIESETNASEFISISGVALDKFDNLYVSQSINPSKYGSDFNNLSKNRVMYYPLAPQLKIPAGNLSGTLTFIGKDDNSDEADETIILSPGSVTNATLSSNSPITLTITDNDAMPTVAFALSAPKIVENSSTDVTLKATPSVVSGKEIRIPFTLSGTATLTTEYTVSANEIVIPANATSGSITISTNGKNDTAVEVMETIKFTVGTLVNATTTTTEIVLNLESDDNSTITSIVALPITFAESASSTITATIDLPSSKDVIVPIAFTGTAKLDEDYNGTFSSKGEETLIKTLPSDILNFTQLANGKIVTLNNYNSISLIDLISNTSSDISLSQSGRKVVSKNNQLYLGDWSRIALLDLTQNPPVQTNVVPVLSNSSIQEYKNGFDFINNKIYYLKVIQNTGVRLILSKELTPQSQEVVVFESQQDFNQIVVTPSEEIYVLYNNIIGKVQNNSLVPILNGYSNNINISDIKYNNGILYLIGMINSKNYIKTVNTLTGSLTDVSYTLGSTITNFNDFAFDIKGNLILNNSLANNGYGLYSYQLTPQLKIPAGSTTGSIILNGIEDDLNYEGQETDESIVLTFANPINSSLQTGVVSSLELKILNNKISLTPVASPFIGLENGAVSWGDYDRDGDQDVAVMGQGISGAVTKVYENKNGVFVDTNQNFTRVYAGDIAWVDINKDGWLDLAVSGSNGTVPLTKIYINDKGTSFSSTIDFGLPQLFSSKMAWGDLDNDGDIDLAITGVDASDKYQFNIYYRQDTENKFIAEPKTINNQSGTFGGVNSTNYLGVINGDIKIVDIDLDGDNDIVYNGENADGAAYSNSLYNTYIKNSINNNINSIYGNTSLTLKNSIIEVARLGSQNSMTILSSGINQSGNIELYSNESLINSVGAASADLIPKLKNGDISVVDFNNDGFNDILFTGEDASGSPQTKLYYQKSNGSFKLAPLSLEGLRNSTANWVDYDNDGDLDLFLTGIASIGGAKTLLYKSEILNKRNTAPAIPSGLVAEDLGNGKIKFQWTPPTDDYSASLGYVVRLGKTPGGTELSNTESNLINGNRLITKQAPIYTTFYEMQLDPGKYYWSVQAVDTGLKGGAFAAESTFTLTYDWKILNQGGIIDRSISGIDAPIVKLADIDNDNDLDLIYENSLGTGSQILQFDGKKLVKQENTNVNNIGNFNKISSSDVGDIDGDKKVDILVNYFDGTSNKLVVLTSSNTILQVGDGLYKSKLRMVDINNDGKLDIVVLGLSSNLISGVPKLWIYEYDKTATPPIFKLTNASADIAALSNSSFDFGDIDKDQDLDLVITGFSPSDGLKSIIYENTTILGGAFKLTATDNNIVAIKDGTTDLIDVDGDGDLDVVITGTGASSDVFEIYMNKLNEGVKNWPRFASGLTAIRNGKIDLGDFNGDGFSDLLYSGTTSGGGKITKLSEYNKNTQQYVDSAFDVSDFTTAEVEFGDLDGDKDLDFVIVGTNKNWSTTNTSVEKNIFRTYINVRNDSAKVLASNISGKSSSTIKTQSVNSTMVAYNVNAAPSVPVYTTNASRIVSTIASTVGKYPVELSWNSSTDDHTPSPGLTYAIKIGTTPGGEEIMSANSNNDGTRKVSTKGNAEHNTKWKVSLPVGKYYWSVQAIDASYSGSAFTEPQTFDVNATGITLNNSPMAIADQITVVKGGTATKLNNNATSVLANDTDFENNTLTAILVDNVINGTLTLNSNGSFIYIHNGSDTTSDSFTYKVNDGTSNSNLVTVNILIVPFTIDYNNFLIETKSETCSGKNNGEISIKATQSYNYTAIINTKTYNFVNNSLILTNLTPGVYDVCINVIGQIFQQCYTLTIVKGGSLTGKALNVSSNKVAIEITEGTAPFEVLLNGSSQFTTDKSNFDIDVKQGDLIMVKSSIACEGIYSKVISDISDGIVAFPNPTKGWFEISVPTTQEEIYIELYSINSKLVSKGFYTVKNQKIELSLENQASGTYIAKVYLDVPLSLTIIKN
jgi:hypothetical protein